ncbi:MAG: chromosomal replication initiator protein DnaA [Bacteroidales bacterium]|jgi:chromosomal replication initiator protein|nr:chromosomal replication initiator protein DnaA [Bacteroidales bacterium]
MAAQFETQWEQCLAIIRENLHNEEAYKAFFASVRAGSYQDGKLTLLVPSHFVYEALESDQYFDLLKKTLQRIYGPTIKLGYRIAVVKAKETDNQPDNNASIHLNAQTRPETKQEPAFDSHLNPNCTLASFCPGRSNELALSAGITVSSRPGENAFNPFFIFGASGVGKTHLAQAIGLKILENDPAKRVLYVTAYQFKVQYTDAVRQNRLNDFINFYQSIDVLIVDDIQEFAGKNLIATQNTFFHIFNHLHQLCKQLIMTCDRPPVELEDLVPRLLTRFKWGFIGEIERPDYELRKGILRSKCEKEGITISNDVIEFIARNATDNVRDLEGVINSLLAHSIAFNRPIDQELATRVLRMIVKIESKVITCENIINLVIQSFNVDMKSLNSKSRKKEIVQARQAAMHLCHQFTTLSVVRIGEVIGNRDHATVLSAFKKVDDMLQTDPNFTVRYKAVEAQLKAKRD